MNENIDIKQIYDDAVKENTIFTTDDIQNILEASTNNNEYLEEQTTETIANIVHNSLNRLNLPNEVITDYYYRLQNYRYIDGINELHKGKHIRWIRNGKLTNGGILTNIPLPKPLFLLAIIISICFGEMHLKSGTDLISANQLHLVVFLPSKQYILFSAALS